MAVELKVPAVGESIAEVEIGEWLKRPGDRVEQDEAVVVLETEKAAMEVPAPETGILLRTLKDAGDTARPGEVIGLIAVEVEAAGLEAGRAEATARPQPLEEVEPAVAEKGVPTGEPVGEVIPSIPAESAPASAAQPAVETAREAVVEREEAPLPGPLTPVREEEIVPMSAVRRRIAERLVQAQQTAALLTTFNEIDMSAVIVLRKEVQALFQERYGVKLGFMSFFVKASIEALKLVSQVNAEIRGSDIVYRNYYDIGIAVAGGRGLVVPVLRSAERLSFAEIERAIDDFARRAGENKLRLEELQGGTFTISNGGIYGSLLSTPIVNPPQSGVLGMHAIQERPVAREGQVVIRPMMYVALTYDHRIVDGREAVTFLRRIKECVEAPARLLLEV